MAQEKTLKIWHRPEVVRMRASDAMGGGNMNTADQFQNKMMQNS